MKTKAIVFIHGMYMNSLCWEHWLPHFQGSADNIIPPSLNKANHAKYGASSSTTDFKEFAGRTHFIIGQKGWEEVADYILAWLTEKGL